MTFKGKKFATIVRQYKAMLEKYPDLHMDYCVQQRKLLDAIEVAAKAIDGENRIHNHQRRVGRIKLDFFSEQLKLKESDIKRAKTFDELLSIIETVKCDRIAELTHYDTATRIGAYLNIFPERIYLHTGTAIGARRLLGNVRGRKFINVEDLPNDFLQYDLTASEFEDILCIFKDDFKMSKSRGWRRAGRSC